MRSLLTEDFGMSCLDPVITLFTVFCLFIQLYLDSHMINSSVPEFPVRGSHPLSGASSDCSHAHVTNMGEPVKGYNEMV